MKLLYWIGVYRSSTYLYVTDGQYSIFIDLFNLYMYMCLPFAGHFREILRI